MAVSIACKFWNSSRNTQKKEDTVDEWTHCLINRDFIELKSVCSTSDFSSEVRNNLFTVFVNSFKDLGNTLETEILHFYITCGSIRSPDKDWDWKWEWKLFGYGRGCFQYVTGKLRKEWVDLCAILRMRTCANSGNFLLNSCSTTARWHLF